MTTIILYALLQFGLGHYDQNPTVQNEANVQYSSEAPDSKGGWDDI